MAQEKNTTKKSEAVGWMASIVQGFFGGVQEVVEQVRQGVRAAGRRLIKRIALLIFSALGVVFFLVGLAQFLSESYQVPGSGAMVVGVFVFFGCLLLYLIENQER